MKAASLALNVGSIALVAILGWVFVRIILGVTTPSSLYEASPMVAPNVTATTRASVLEYDFTTDPFSFGEMAAVTTEPVEDAPETTLNLTLIGIISESSATFRLADGKDKPVAIGAEVMNGVTLTATARGHVILDVNGDTQKLTLERIKLDEKTDNPVISRAPAKTSGQMSDVNVQKLLAQMKMTPTNATLSDGSNRQGFKIEPKGRANLSQYGLKKGDVVTRIGSVTLDNGPVDTKAVIEMVSNGTSQDLELIRDGKSVIIRIGQ